MEPMEPQRQSASKLMEPKRASKPTVDNNEAYIELIKNFTARGYYGEVTFYFQNGIIEACRKSERNTKEEIREFIRRERELSKTGKTESNGRVVVIRDSAARPGQPARQGAAHG